MTPEQVEELAIDIEQWGVPVTRRVLVATALREQAKRIEELEAGLRETALQIEYLHGKFAETGSGNAVASRIRALTQETTP